MDTSSSVPFRNGANQNAHRNPLAAMDGIAKSAHCGVGETIYFQDDPADHWYRLVNGAARKCVLMTDGRRQIVDFMFPGDLFGWSRQDVHRFSVEAITADTTVARYPRRRIEMLAESDSEARRRIFEEAFESISRLQMRMVLLGRTSAQEKVSAFLLEMAERCGAGCGNVVVLPMSRYDIADYLSISVETVSRTLTKLRRRGAISLDSTRLVQIVDRSALEECGCLYA